MNPLETYLQELRDIRSTGAAVKETSYYGALEQLFNNLGKDLKPKVRCVMQLKNRGAGMPDGGLFTARQFQRQSGNEPVNPENPEQGVIEIKGTGDDAWVIADTKQVSKYWERYGQVLVTNYRDFLLIGRDAKGQPVKLETYRLAENEADFWAKAANPRKVTEEQGEQFTEYLKRVMLHAATITSPQDVAWFLASYARDAKARIEKTDLPTLANVRKALEEVLGIGFNEEKGKRFFKSTLIQTLFYGIFSAWVLWHKQGEEGKFDWRTAGHYLRVPMIQALFDKMATPQNLRRLDLVEVLDWTGNALNRVDRESFFSKFDEGQAVQYFYEPFLKAFDPELRKELGVWYTPPEIVQYMVARVDTVLREELGIEDGLANENVYILDPCCGTGAYLVEVIKRIHATLQEKGMDSLIGFDLKKAAINRVFGFELLTAPFVVAHLQLGLLLQNLGVPLVDEKERVGVYLTNALTGWEPPQELLIASAELGRRVAALLDPENLVTGVTSGKICPELQVIAIISRVTEGNWNPEKDFALTAGWGHTGQNNVTMPGKGRLTERQYTSEEQSAMGEAIHQLGKKTCDIYLNDIAYWQNIPARVWDYTIGGYQVIKKWLSYREKPLLGRPLKVEEVREVTNIVRRIAAILMLKPDLDTNYEKVKQSTYTWPK